MIDEINKLYEKYSIIVKLIVFFAPLVFATWKYIDKFINIPDDIKSLKTEYQQKMTKDSLQAIYYIHEIDSLKQVSVKQNKWICKMWYRIDSLSTNKNYKFKPL